MNYYLKFIFIFIILAVPSYALDIVKKYPSYSYVFSEFDVDRSYIYNSDFNNFVQKKENILKGFYRRSLQRGKDILPMMKGLLVGEGVSDLFIYLSMVESGFSSSAMSPKKAAGLWQFMPATAKNYNLTVGNAYDERYDTVSATSAAINYLNKLHKQFGKWYVAAMAYNCGEGCVERAIKKAGTDDIAVLTNNRLKYLPLETRNYIKKILLVAMIGENYGLGLEEVSSSENTLTSVEVSGGTNLKDVAKLIKINYKEILKLNRKVKNGILPTKKEKYKIMIPIEKIYAFYLRYELNRKVEAVRSHLISHYVKLGETLESIAKQYNSSSEEIEITNHLEDEYLLLNQFLVIPVTKKVFDDALIDIK